nr:acid-sensing ion channel 1C-like [Lytechinus pictus]
MSASRRGDEKKSGFNMPRSLIKVAPAVETEADTLPEKKGIETVSGGLQAPSSKSPPPVFPDDIPLHMRYRDKVSWWAILYRSVPDAIGIGGMKYAFNPAEVKWRRFSWLLLVMGAFGALTYQVVDRAQHFASHPKSVDVSINYTAPITFPSVAICNYNTFRASLLSGTELGEFLTTAATDPASLDMNDYYDLLTSTNMSHLMKNYAQELNLSVLFAKFGGSNIDIEANFSVALTEWGPCFIFNDANNGYPPATVERAGKAYGLELMLDVEQWEYFFGPFNRISAGFQILLYDYDSVPMVEDHGFGISPGTHSHVGIEVTDVNNLEPPFGSCEDKELKYFDHYGYAECDHECKGDFYIEHCGCVPWAAPENDSLVECNNWELYTCVFPNSALFVTNHTCDCPVPCSFRTYKPTVSTTQFPSTFWTNVYSALYGFPAEVFPENICYLSIYFQEMSIQQINQQVDYTFFSLLCDIGGSLGLWLGGSVLTVFEFCDLFSNSIYVYSKRVPNRF